MQLTKGQLNLLEDIKNSIEVDDERWFMKTMELLKNNHKISINKINKFFPLHLAAAYGRLHFVKYLIENEQYNINQEDENHQTPLMSTVKCDSQRIIPVIQYFLDNSADINFKNRKSDTTLSLSIKEGNVTVSLHIAKHENLKKMNEKEERAIISLCKVYGHPEIMKDVKKKCWMDQMNNKKISNYSSEIWSKNRKSSVTQSNNINDHYTKLPNDIYGGLKMRSMERCHKKKRKPLSTKTRSSTEVFVDQMEKVGRYPNLFQPKSIVLCQKKRMSNHHEKFYPTLTKYLT
ncbi:hypothetical protein SNEBB_010518 [Seison nebaliae]|nr:hypothetical protein SNEBB_010518 [Seison nebaliae]